MSEYQITQRSLDGGRPLGQLTLDGNVVREADLSEEDDECE